MKTDFLKSLGLEKDVIDKIMAENGKDITREQTKTATAEASIADLKGQLETANTTLKSFDGVDVKELKGKITELTTSLDTKGKEYKTQISQLETKGKVNEFLGEKKFINEATKSFYADKVFKDLQEDTSKGKSLDDLLKAYTQDEKGENKPNIFAPTQPTAGNINPLLGKETKITDKFTNALMQGAGIKQED